jgi:hypothetical protein
VRQSSPPTNAAHWTAASLVAAHSARGAVYHTLLGDDELAGMALGITPGKIDVGNKSGPRPVLSASGLAPPASLRYLSSPRGRSRSLTEQKITKQKVTPKHL